MVTTRPLHNTAMIPSTAIRRRGKAALNEQNIINNGETWSKRLHWNLKKRRFFKTLIGTILMTSIMIFYIKSLPKQQQPQLVLKVSTKNDIVVNVDAGDLASCQSSIQNPPEKIDIVIPYEYREESDVSLKYELRSFEKSGMLDHVGTVFIIASTKENVVDITARYQSYITKMNEDVVVAAAAEAKWWPFKIHADAATTTTSSTLTQLRIIAMDEIKVPFNVEKFKENSKLGKSHYSPYLPQISEYYVLVPDDIVILRNYTRDIWFDKQKSLPYGHSFGSWRGGNTHRFANIAELHGVNFLNRCTMQYVIQKYNVTDPEDLSPTAVALGTMKRENLLAGFYPYHSNLFRGVKPYETEFFRECHTNGGCGSPNNFQEIFVNIQGGGISIEYGEGENNDRYKKLFTDWFDNTFPTPSRFE